MTVQRTLDDLDPPPWGPAIDGSYLVRRCHELRSKPLGEFTIEDLRIMIGQEIGLAFLVPPAIAELWKNPLAEGDYYPGDLLSMVLQVKPVFWQNNPALAAELDLALDELPDDFGLNADTDRKLRDRTDTFRGYARELRRR